MNGHVCHRINVIGTILDVNSIISKDVKESIVRFKKESLNNSRTKSETNFTLDAVVK